MLRIIHLFFIIHGECPRHLQLEAMNVHILPLKLNRILYVFRYLILITYIGFIRAN